MNKRIKELIEKDMRTKDLTHEEYLEIEKYLENTGLVYNFTHKEMCQACLKQPIVESSKKE